MSELHLLHVTANDQAHIEGVDQKFLAAGLLKARERTIEVVARIASLLEDGMSENEARLMAIQTFRAHGVTKHWHQPYIRFGEGSVLSFHEPISESKLRANDIFHIDVGPVWPGEALGMSEKLEYEGDFGDSFIFGENSDASKLIRTVHEIFALGQDKWKSERLSGIELYAYLKTQTEVRGYTFIDGVAGHRLGDFPHHKYTKERLAKVEFIPSDSLWVLEVMITDPQKKIGAFFEDLLM